MQINYLVKTQSRFLDLLVQLFIVVQNNRLPNWRSAYCTATRLLVTLHMPPPPGEKTWVG